MLLNGRTGQLAVAQEIMADLGIDDVPLVGVAKGPDRDAGLERLFLPGKTPFTLEPKSPVLYYLQRLRDEAHRFAIGAHRAKRSAAVRGAPQGFHAAQGVRVVLVGMEGSDVDVCGRSQTEHGHRPRR